MDRQYNAVNFQYFAQAAEAGVTKAGAEASFKRRLCTSRLSFYIEAGRFGLRWCPYFVEPFMSYNLVDMGLYIL